MLVTRELVRQLTGKSSARRRKAAKVATEEVIPGICDALIEAYECDRGSRSWQTRGTVVRAIGVQGCTKAEPLLRSLTFDTSVDCAMVRLRAATALVKVMRRDLTDASPIFEVLEKGDYSAKEGALDALGYDRMTPPAEECETLLEICQSLGEGRATGLSDPRYGLVAACAGWYTPGVIPFLEACAACGDAPVEYVAKKALRREYAKLRAFA